MVFFNLFLIFFILIFFFKFKILEVFKDFFKFFKNIIIKKFKSFKKLYFINSFEFPDIFLKNHLWNKNLGFIDSSFIFKYFELGNIFLKNFFYEFFSLIGFKFDFYIFFFKYYYNFSCNKILGNLRLKSKVLNYLKFFKVNLYLI